ncbi:NLPA lipoprotein [Caldalkalibacillus thermarum TA2.A1]|uniref:Lipoprotein n=1 Tax=Caldalkalibacillus thermarum (strain TA2.A1) TaxID=986075 RepID=F5L7H9_CALTT|nr:MetQ/NlpA family ABC transporter substrate-binding protein [Caldalkalibacillus thermarum]EGL82693.1 NLPA lipoprotein [Caldalkalibacillus thermarum TA2.A1]QZT33762.1 MetQ/NlpA family ABC transporter substrate-binding protein [Caldalkalibacillus thermarum TA2.A1]GGK22100.1 TonB-dependent receptor [Caldalkalibacillus thermarum]
MRKLVLLSLVFVLALGLAACGQAGEQNDEAAPEETQEETTQEEGQEEGTVEGGKLVVGATQVPHAEILNEVVKPLLAEEGIELQVEVFSDYVLPNQFLAEGDLDANFFQHIPYLESQNEQHGYDLVVVTGVHIEPMGGYSAHYDSIEELPEGAKILHPDAVSEVGRVLKLLESHGLIKLADDVGFYGTVRDIVENPHNFEFVGMEAATVAQAYEDADLAIINTNYALQVGLTPAQDALILESPEDNPYVNVLATVKERENDPLIQKLAEALNSEEVRQFIEERYEGNVLPAF